MTGRLAARCDGPPEDTAMSQGSVSRLLRIPTLRVAGALCACVLSISVAGCGPTPSPPASAPGGVSQRPANPPAADPQDINPPIVVPVEPPRDQPAPPVPVQPDPPPVEVQPCTPLLDGNGNSTSSC
jgi:hypothetical protein